MMANNTLRATVLGTALGLCTGYGAVHAQAPVGATGTQPAGMNAADPGKQRPAEVTISSIDFKRGTDGAGRLIMRFSGDGAAPDLQTQGSSVVVNVGNAQLPASLQQSLNVTDFATPVQRIDPSSGAGGARIVLNNSGAFESMAYQTGRDYVVEIVPRAAASRRAVGAAPAAAIATAGQSASSAAVNGQPAYTGKRLTFNFQDVSVRSVLQIIAEEANLNIAAADTVQGNVTLRLMEVPWDQALDILLQAKGLDKRRNGNVIWVAPQSEIAKYEQDVQDARINLENKAEMVTEYIPLSYSSAEDVAKLLTDDSKNSSGGGAAGGTSTQRGFLSPRGSLSFDRRTNTLLVIDIPNRIGDIKKLVEYLDKPVDQVVIEGRIVIANENFARELGAKFGISGNKNNTYFSGNLEANTANRNADATAQQNYISALNTWRQAHAAWESSTSDNPGPEPQAPLRSAYPSSITRGLGVDLGGLATNVGGSMGSLALSVLNAGYLLDIELSAMQTEGRGEVISNPRIVTSNQKEAVIKQGTEVGYLTVTGSAGGGAVVPQAQFKEALLEMRVTPTITNDGRVFLNMNVKKDEVDGFTSTGFGDVPNIAKREVNTAILVEDGQTVVVGGVYEFKNRSDLTKVPFLGDIPVLGNLFKKRGRSSTKAELLIFVTPKVLKVAPKHD